MNTLRSWRRLALALVSLAALLAMAFALVPVRADVTVLMPDRQGGELGLLLRAMQEGPSNRIILIALEPLTGEQPLREPRALSRAAKAELQSSGLFEHVMNGEVSLDDSTFQPFFKHRYLLNPPLDPAQFSAAGLRIALVTLLERLQGFAAPLVESIMGADPTLRSLDVAALWAPTASARKRQGVWVGGDGQRVLVLATTANAGYDFLRQQTTMLAIQTAAASLEAKFGPLRLTYSGPSVIAVESRRRGESESRRLMLISIPMVAGILLLFFRHVAVLFLASLPLAAGFLTGTVLVATIFGFIHVTTLGFGVTLIGIAVDYPLHLLAHVRGDNPPQQAARRIWPALFLGAATTIVGFLPLVFSSFPGVAQLGVFTVAGIAAAASAARWLLPYAIPDAMIVPRPRSNWAAMGVFRQVRRLRPFALVLGALALVQLLTQGPSLWQRDLAALSPIPESLMVQDRELRRDLSVASPRHLLTVGGESVDVVLQRSEALMPLLDALQANGAFEAYELAARYVPSLAEQRSRLAAMPDAGTLRANMAQAQSGLPFTPDAFEPFLNAVGKAKTAGPIEPADIEAPSLRLRLESLLFPDGGGYRGLVLLRGLQNPGELRGALDETGLAGVRYLDIKEATQGLMDGYRVETLFAAALGGALALVLLLVSIRTSKGMAEVALPVGLSVLTTAAAMSLISEGLTIFHLLALLMVAGLGIDYAVFLRRSAGAAGDEGTERADDLRAVCLCAATSISVFAILASASIPLLSQIGSTVALGSTLSLIFGLAFTASQQDRPA